MIPEFNFGPVANEHPEAFLAIIIGAVLFFLAIYKMPASIPLGWPFLRNELKTRAERIEADKIQIEKELADIQQLRNDYANRLQSIEAEARQRIDAAVQEAETARVEIIADARQAAEALRHRSEEEIARERTRQRILLRQQIVQITLDAAESAARANTNDNVQRQLIQDFIARAGSDGIKAETTVAVPAANLSASGGA